MLASERFSMIVKMVNDRKYISTKELALSLNVTETTIRRDCEELEKDGLLIRVHGGAKSLKTENVLTREKEQRMSERGHISEKNRVAQRAASIVKDGDCIFLDGGTSIVPMVKYLKDKKIKRLLLIATGALMNSTSSQQGESIPGIAHAISIEM